MTTIELTYDEVAILQEALDEAEYWAQGTHGELPVNNGYVWLPGDYEGEGEDPFWVDPPTEEEQAAIDHVRAMRALAERLRNLKH